MKSRKKNRVKKGQRWKWMAGAAAATAAGVSGSQASLVTISLVGNYVAVFGGDHLNPDLTGDGHPDLALIHPYTGYFNRDITVNGIHAGVFWGDSGAPTHFSAFMRLGSRSANWSENRHPNSTTTRGTRSLTGSIPIFFKDLHINGGAPTEGSLEVTVSGPGASISLDSLTYNTNTPTTGFRVATVQDQGSSLALLAMGAGGVLALRRWRAAQEHS